MREIILYYNSNYRGYNTFRFYDVTSNNIVNVDDKDINKDINNLWIDYSSFHEDDKFINPYNTNNDITTLINWILKRKYSIICPFRDVSDIRDISDEYINLYTNHRKEIEEIDKTSFYS